MRTLSRPMFNMGGPIKQGIMHGIREPYAHGTRVGAGLVGDPIFPRTGGRSHHAIQAAALLWPQIASLFGRQAVKKGITSLTQGQLFKKGIQESVKKAAGSGGAGSASDVAGAAASGWKNIGKNWFSGDPTVKGAKWGWKALTSPTANTLAQKTVRSIFSPTGIALGAGWYLLPDGSKRQTPPPTGIMKPGGYPGAVVKEEARVLSDAERKAFANKQRSERVQKYLDVMGYDRSKKTAIADALIDASKIVGDRGSLDPKNITQELINPIIQATSKRLDKPEQIREAVGLMMTKADLEKEMYEAKPGTVLKNVQDMVKSGQYTEKEAWAIATKEPGSASELILAHMGSKRGKLSDEYITTLMRSYGEDKGLPVKVVTDTDMLEKFGKDTTKHPNAMELITSENITEDGIYQVGGEVIQIIDGKPTQIK